MLASLYNNLRITGRVGLLVIVTAGCSVPEIDRPGTWKPTDINDYNLRAMLVNPQDSSFGTGALTARGDAGSRAVTRLLTDKRRSLLQATVSQVAPAAGGGGDSGSVAIPGTGSSGGAP